MKKAQKESPLMEMVGRYQIGRGVFVYKKKRYAYLILSKDFEPNLPGFLGYPEQKELIISEEVPKAFRKFMLIHEIIEFTDLAGKQGRCLEALKIELKLVPKKIWRDYLRYRKNFFRVLIEYSQKHPDEEFKHEIKKSYEYLCQISQD